MEFRGSDLGFRVLWFRVRGSGFRKASISLGFRVSGLFGEGRVRVHDALADNGAFRARARHETPLRRGRGRESGRVDKVAEAVVGPACEVGEVAVARVGRAWCNGKPLTV